MKKFICIICAVLLLVSVMCGCAGKTVETKVNPKYADDFVTKYADSSEVDSDGNVTYKFSDEKYEQFVEDYYDEVVADSREEIESSGQYSYYNDDITEVVVGVTPESFESMGEQALKEEAQRVGEQALKFQMNTENPSGVVTVIYRNANTSEEYFSITVSAE